MNPERWQRIEDLFLAARELDADARAALLARECAGDVELRRDVESMLAAAEAEPDFLEDAPIARARAAAGPETIGDWRVERLIGRGGMGEVYLAVREGEGFRQQGAIKLIRQGLATDDFLRRFRNERRILARLDHPGIARFLDGGATADGVPYLVMEYVDGLPLPEYCDEHRLSVRDRLALFLQVCAAVHHAHQNLVVHRDLKPSNIMITAQGAPKLLDFGIGKILSDDTAAGEPLTRTGHRVFTPHYASPEQIAGLPLTTASDIYSLGVLLYELLISRAPYRVRDTSIGELERAILEQEPETPSTALDRPPAAAHTGGTVEPTPDQVSERRGTIAARLRRTISGDLDNIVLRALRKEPERRYASAQALAEDIQRFLDGRPVRARPDTFRYRASRFLRRNRVPVATTAALLLALAAATFFVFAQSVRIRRQSTAIAFERDRAREVVDFLSTLFRSADPDRASGADVTARELLDRGAARIDQEVSDPEIRAELLSVVGPIYLNIGLYDDAERLAREALDLRRSLFDEPNDAIAKSELDLAEALHWKNEYDDAERLYRDAAAQMRALHPDGSGELSHTLALLARVIFQSRSDMEAADSLYSRALAVGRAVHGENHPDVAFALEGLGILARYRGQFDSAQAYYEEALRIRTATQGEDHYDVAATLNNLAIIAGSKGQMAEAGRLFRRALDIWRKVLGPDHPNVADGLNNLARLRWLNGDLDEAEQLYREALEIRTRALGPDHPTTAQSWANLGALLEAKNDFVGAEQAHRTAMRIRIAALGETHPSVTESVQFLAGVAARAGRTGEAVRLLRDRVALLTPSADANPPEATAVVIQLSEILTVAGRFPEAETALLERLDRVRAAGDARQRMALAQALEGLYQAWGKPDQAARYGEMSRDTTSR